MTTDELPTAGFVAENIRVYEPDQGQSEARPAFDYLPYG